jgi:hypothetical protein
MQEAIYSADNLFPVKEDGWVPGKEIFSCAWEKPEITEQIAQEKRIDRMYKPELRRSIIQIHCPI